MHSLEFQVGKDGAELGKAGPLHHMGVTWSFKQAQLATFDDAFNKQAARVRHLHAFVNWKDMHTETLCII